MDKHRIEKDTLGKIKVPSDAYYGAQTQRAKENFPISNLRLQQRFIKSYAIIKKAAALANISAGKLNRKIGNAIVKACNEIIDGKFREQFVVDVYQAGAGTSTNMNLNEVIANRAIEILGSKKGNYKLIHPNDHVNMSQSTNDTFHSAIHIATVEAVSTQLIPVLEKYQKVLKGKINEFNPIVKSGRTHLQDAVPLTLGQEFSGYVIDHRIKEIKMAADALRELNIGGTAIGTGLNTYPKYSMLAVKEISKMTKEKFEVTKNMFAATQNINNEAGLSGTLKNLALTFVKISNDLKLLSSGPNTGFNEITLPAVQPGSSIMPGKINPSIPEMLNMVGFQVAGNDLSISMASQNGQLELNVMMPLVAYNLLNSIEILSNAINVFTEKCLKGIKANKKKIEEHLEKNPIIVTALAPKIGYEKAADVAKKAYKENKTIREVCIEMKLFTAKELNKILNFKKLSGL